MACGSCGSRARMAHRFEFVWTSEDGTATKVYPKEAIAVAKVRRVGGSYEKREKATR